MQDCLLRTHMIPVRDEDAESQRKAKSRQARQTRRATQGVTLSELIEAKKTFSPSKLETQPGEVCRSTERLCVQRRVHEDTTDSSPPMKTLEQAEELLDEQGNWKRRPGPNPERSSFCISSVKGACGFTPSLNNNSSLKESEWMDENDNILYGCSGASLAQKLIEDSDLPVFTELATYVSGLEKQRGVDLDDGVDQVDSSLWWVYIEKTCLAAEFREMKL
ncbi:protein phosphatase 1 regulatory subunit 12B-like [Danio aesculapii]|uniref:protein phosphatase 1 regulatory subunit 12B-like n=1 Tax=Danio aesculapii TaxID=1142201 RepID=UPI0024C0E675|nr:protein phosphatase 1 regulatory subunit 12B-like [Danio aesculapii]